MTRLLEKAFKKASHLPVVEQNAFAKWILEELESDRKWEETFAESEDLLEQLANGALRDHQKGKTKILDIEEF